MKEQESNPDEDDLTAQIKKAVKELKEKAENILKGSNV